MNEKYYNKIIGTWIGDFDNFRIFLKGKRDSYFYESEKKISVKEFGDFCNLLPLIYVSKPSLHFIILMEKTSIFVTNNKRKFKSIDKYKGKRICEKEFHLLMGNLLSIPKCCIKKYVEDNEKQKDLKRIVSSAPAKRYLKQLKEMKIKKDKFEVKCKINSIDYLFFIPCSPKCNSALNLLKKYQK